jgi:hypothetical protein
MCINTHLQIDPVQADYLSLLQSLMHCTTANASVSDTPNRVYHCKQPLILPWPARSTQQQAGLTTRCTTPCHSYGANQESATRRLQHPLQGCVISQK